MKQGLSVLLAMVLSTELAPAMDRLGALSEIESHNNDHAIGRQREVSRFQIMPAFWAEAKAWNITRQGEPPTNPQSAEAVVSWIMQTRCRAFEGRYHRSPNDFEYYILWHRPACLVGRTTPRHLTALEADRGRRFALLCQSGD